MGSWHGLKTTRTYHSLAINLACAFAVCYEPHGGGQKELVYIHISVYLYIVYGHPYICIDVGVCTRSSNQVMP